MLKVWWVLRRGAVMRLPSVIRAHSARETSYWETSGYVLLAKLERCRKGQHRVLWYLVRKDCLAAGCSAAPSLVMPCLDGPGNGGGGVGVAEVVGDLIVKSVSIQAAGDSDGIDAPAFIQQALQVVDAFGVQGESLDELGESGGIGHGGSIVLLGRSSCKSKMRLLCWPQMQPEGAQ